MKIQADAEGRAVLIQICDQARKVCDLNSVGNILGVINMIEGIPEKKRPVVPKVEERAEAEIPKKPKKSKKK